MEHCMRCKEFNMLMLWNVGWKRGAWAAVAITHAIEEHLVIA